MFHRNKENLPNSSGKKSKLGPDIEDLKRKISNILIEIFGESYQTEGMKAVGLWHGSIDNWVSIAKQDIFFIPEKHIFDLETEITNIAKEAFRKEGTSSQTPKEIAIAVALSKLVIGEAYQRQGTEWVKSQKINEANRFFSRASYNFDLAENALKNVIGYSVNQVQEKIAVARSTFSLIQVKFVEEGKKALDAAKTNLDAKMKIIAVKEESDFYLSAELANAQAECLQAQARYNRLNIPSVIEKHYSDAQKYFDTAMDFYKNSDKSVDPEVNIQLDQISNQLVIRQQEVAVLATIRKPEIAVPPAIVVSASIRKQRTAIEKLKKYITERTKQKESEYGFYNFFVGIVSGNDAQTKIEVAGKLLSILEKPNVRVEFTLQEYNALQQGKLGEIYETVSKSDQEQLITAIKSPTCCF